MTARLLPSRFNAGGGWELAMLKLKQVSLPYLTAVGRGIVLGGWGLWM